jgi:hypothetical protein
MYGILSHTRRSGYRRRIDYVSTAGLPPAIGLLEKTNFIITHATGS